MAIRVVGFDLDGTLLYLDQEFIFAYMALLNETVGTELGVPQLSEAVLASTAVMCASDGREGSLAEVFFADFGGRVGIARSLLQERFDQFYEKEFVQLQRFSRPVAGVHGLLAEIRSQGCQLALVTNPVFPLSAIQERLRWAGLEDVPFDWMTHFEQARTAKPQPQFFQDAARELRVPATDWLVVGNDLQDDILPARRVGMQTYWVSEEEAPDKCPKGSGMGAIYGVLDYLKQLQN